MNGPVAHAPHDFRGFRGQSVQALGQLHTEGLDERCLGSHNGRVDCGWSCRRRAGSRLRPFFVRRPSLARRFPFHFFFLLRVFLNRMWISPTRRGSISRTTSWGMATTGREDVALALSVPVCSLSFSGAVPGSPRLSDTVCSPLLPLFLPLLLPDGVVRNGSNRRLSGICWQAP